MGDEAREYTLTFEGLNIENDNPWSDRAEEYVELEDMTDYILEEDREEVNKYIEKLQRYIRSLKCEIAHLNGKVETWEKSWRIWNNVD